MDAMYSDTMVLVKTYSYIFINFCKEICNNDHSESCEYRKNTPFISCITFINKEEMFQANLPGFRVCYCDPTWIILNDPSSSVTEVSV